MNYSDMSFESGKEASFFSSFFIAFIFLYAIYIFYESSLTVDDFLVYLMLISGIVFVVYELIVEVYRFRLKKKLIRYVSFNENCTVISPYRGGDVEVSRDDIKKISFYKVSKYFHINRAFPKQICPGVKQENINRTPRCIELKDGRKYILGPMMRSFETVLEKLSLLNDTHPIDNIRNIDSETYIFESSDSNFYKAQGARTNIISFLLLSCFALLANYCINSVFFGIDTYDGVSDILFNFKFSILFVLIGVKHELIDGKRNIYKVQVSVNDIELTTEYTDVHKNHLSDLLFAENSKPDGSNIASAKYGEYGFDIKFKDGKKYHISRHIQKINELRQILKAKLPDVAFIERKWGSNP